MYSEMDKMLLEALTEIPPRYSDAEMFRALGADVNAFGDGISLLSEAIANRDAKTSEELVDYFIHHGFNGHLHEGRHLLSALEVFSWGDDEGYGFDDPLLVETFKVLLRRNPGVASLPNENGEDLEDVLRFKARIYDIEEGAPDRNCLCLLLAEIARRAKKGQDFSTLRGWNAASGMCLRDIRLNPEKTGCVQLDFDKVTLTVGTYALWVESKPAGADSDAPAEFREQFSDLIGLKVAGIGLLMTGVTDESPYTLCLRFDAENSLLVTPGFDHSIALSRRRGAMKVMTWTDKQLADVLAKEVADLSQAEEWLRRGADVNAIDSNEIDHEGTLSRALRRGPGYYMELILDWLEQYGHQPQAFGGEHILSALYALPGAYPEEISVLSRLLGMAVSMPVPIKYKAAEEPLLDQMIHGAQCLESAARDAEAAAVCRIKAEVVRRFETGLPYRDIQGWDKALALAVEAVKLLVPDHEAASPVFYDVDAGHGVRRCHRGELALYAGDRVLVILNGRHPMICRKGDELVDAKVAVETGSAFKTLLGKTILGVKVLGPDWEKTDVSTVSICFTGKTRLSSGFIVERSAGKARLNPTATLLTAQ